MNRAKTEYLRRQKHIARKTKKGRPFHLLHDEQATGKVVEYDWDSDEYLVYLDGLDPGTDWENNPIPPQIVRISRGSVVLT